AVGGEENRHRRLHAGRELQQRLLDILDDRRNQPWRPMSTADVTHRAGTLQRRPCLFNLLLIGPRAQRELLRSQTETDDEFGSVAEQLGIGFLDKWMPMS